MMVWLPRYYRPVDRWNDAKKQEFEKRNDYNIG